jgi:hypothetical protein
MSKGRKATCDREFYGRWERGTTWQLGCGGICDLCRARIQECHASRPSVHEEKTVGGVQPESLPYLFTRLASLLVSLRIARGCSSRRSCTKYCAGAVSQALWLGSSHSATATGTPWPFL